MPRTRAFSLGTERFSCVHVVLCKNSVGCAYEKSCSCYSYMRVSFAFVRISCETGCWPVFASGARRAYAAKCVGRTTRHAHRHASCLNGTHTHFIIGTTATLRINHAACDRDMRCVCVVSCVCVFVFTLHYNYYQGDEKRSILWRAFRGAVDGGSCKTHTRMKRKHCTEISANANTRQIFVQAHCQARSLRINSHEAKRIRMLSAQRAPCTSADHT